MPPKMNAKDLVKSVRAAFDTEKTLPLAYRREQLEKLRAMVSENEDAICDAVKKDVGRGKPEAKMADVQFTVNEINTALENLNSWTANKKVSKTIVQLLDSAYIAKDPLGVVLIIAPWNYPVQLCICPLAGAIAAGNCAVVKPSELSAHTSKLLGELIPKYLDQECYRVQEGGVPETTELLKERFDHIFYTGNPMVGKIIMKAAAEYLTPVTLELGGKSPCIVDCDNTTLTTAVHRIMWGKFLNCGQTCVAVDYVLLIGSEEKQKEFVNECEKVIKEFYGDDVSASGDYAHIVNERHFDRVCKLIDSSKGTAVIGGKKRDKGTLFIEPTILTNVDFQDAIMNEEIFGPVMPIVRVDSLKDAIKIVKSKEKPLALYLFSDNKENVEHIIRHTSSGGVTINDIMLHMTLDTLPFGGVGQSGIGRTHGQFSFDAFTHEKAVLHRGLTGESMLWMRYPPFDERKAYWLDKVLVKRKLPFM